MKPVRYFLIGLGFLILLLIAAVVLALNSGVQTWAARRALAAQPDLAGEIGRVRVTPQRIEATEVVVRQEGMVLTLPSFTADLSVIGAARQRLDITRLVAKGWTLDLTATANGASPAAPAAKGASLLPLVIGAVAQESPASTTKAALPFGNLLAAFELPVDIVRLDGVELEGTVIFPAGPEGGVGRAHVIIVGGGVAPGQDGKFQITAKAALPGGAAPVTAVALRSELGARLDTPRSFDRITTTSTVEASGGTLRQPAQLMIDAAAGAAAEGDVYTVQLRTPDASLFSIDARSAASTPGQLLGRWRLDVNDHQVAPFTLGYPLPTFAASGQGTMQFNTLDQSVELAGQFQTNLSRLEAVMPQLQAVGRILTTALFDVRVAGPELRVKQLRIGVEADQPVAELTALQGLEFNRDTGEFRVAEPEAELLELKLHQLPLAWLAPFLPGFTLAGGPAQGSWTAAARDGGFAVHSTSPLRIGGLSLTQGEAPLLQAVDIALSPTAEYTPFGWQARVEGGHVQSRNTRLINFDARAGQAAAPGAALVATLRFDGDLPALLAQPVGEPYRLLQAGLGSGDVIVALKEQGKTETAMKLELTGLVATTGQKLPRVAVEVRADQDADGRIEAHVPLLVTHEGRASDLTVNAQVRPVGEGLRVEGIMRGQYLFVPDLQLFAAPFAVADDQPAPPPDPSAGPPWAGIEGKLSLAFGQVVYSESVSVANVQGEVAITPEGIRIANFQAGLPTGGVVELAAAVSYDAGQSLPYALEGNFTGTQVEVAPLMRLAMPGASAPPLEGKFDLRTTLSGRAADLAGLADQANAEARLSSRGGVLRALSVNVGEYARAGSTLANVAGLIGSITGDSRTQRYAERFKAANELAANLANLNFDQLQIELARRPGQDLQVKDFSLISPMFRLLGSGAIGVQPGTSFWQAPLQLRVQLGAREAMASHLRTLRLLRDETDNLGYAPMLEDFRLEGSLARITTSQLQSLISRALASP